MYHGCTKDLVLASKTAAIYESIQKPSSVAIKLEGKLSNLREGEVATNIRFCSDGAGIAKKIGDAYFPATEKLRNGPENRAARGRGHSR